MEITVKKNYFRMSPRKVRTFMHNMRGQTAEATLSRLIFTQKKAAQALTALLKSGIAAAREQDVPTDTLIIKSVACNEGPRYKRRRFEAKGRTRRITKRTSHLIMTLTNEPIETSTKANDVSALAQTVEAEQTQTEAKE